MDFKAFLQMVRKRLGGFYGNNYQRNSLNVAKR